MTNYEIKELLILAQDGNEIAQDKILIYIRDNIMGARINKYLYKNRQADAEDIKQEFMIGVALNIHKADIDIGDPIEYLISQGIWRVRSYIRSQILKSTTMVCCDCGNVSRLNMIDGKYSCKKCGGNNIVTQETNDLDDGTNLNMIKDEENFENEIIFNQLMIEFEGILGRGTKVSELYFLLKNGINSNNPQIKNYIKEIANLWGTSQTNVVKNLDKLRSRLRKYAEENGMKIEDNKFINL